MPSDKFTMALLAAVLCLLSGTSGRADTAPPAWADPAQSCALEELLYRASQSGDRDALSAAHARIVTQDLPLIKHIQDLIARDDTAALQRLGLGMTACHYAGMSIRLLILMAYETDEAKDARTVSIAAEEAARFADHLNRCEMTSHKPGIPRLIGAS